MIIVDIEEKKEKEIK